MCHSLSQATEPDVQVTDDDDDDALNVSQLEPDHKAPFLLIT